MRIATLSWAILTLTATVGAAVGKPATAVKLPDGTVSFVQPPRLVSVTTPDTDTNVWGATYYFTIELPLTAGEPLQKVTFSQTEGTSRIRSALWVRAFPWARETPPGDARRLLRADARATPSRFEDRYRGLPVLKSSLGAGNPTVGSRGRGEPPHAIDLAFRTFRYCGKTPLAGLPGNPSNAVAPLLMRTPLTADD